MLQEPHFSTSRSLPFLHESSSTYSERHWSSSSQHYPQGYIAPNDVLGNPYNENMGLCSPQTLSDPLSFPATVEYDNTAVNDDPHPQDAYPGHHYEYSNDTMNESSFHPNFDISHEISAIDNLQQDHSLEYHVSDDLGESQHTASPFLNPPLQTHFTTPQMNSIMNRDAQFSPILSEHPTDPRHSYTSTPLVVSHPLSASEEITRTISPLTIFSQATVPEPTKRKKRGSPQSDATPTQTSGRRKATNTRKRARGNSVSPPLNDVYLDGRNGFKQKPSKRRRVAYRRSESNKSNASEESVSQGISTEESTPADESGEEEATSDDAYVPSKSPSPGFDGGAKRRGRTRQSFGKKNRMSAAMALRAAERQLENQRSAYSLTIKGEDLSPSRADSPLTADSLPDSEVAKPKTARRGVPVPVPNLVKKSRGRKVPVDASTAQTLVKREEPALVNGWTEEGETQAGPSTYPQDAEVEQPVPASGSMKEVPGGIKKSTGARRYVCTVDGCGKCFVRGEHLKRHVRSLHTWDKPHVCPYEGCGKSFSRRDNLGQHVRVHM